jgi:septum formation protein
MAPLILASKSSVRQQLLRQCGVPFTVQTAPVDEDSVRQAMAAENISPRNMADALAELKAARMAQKRPDAFVLGCDQILEFERTAWGKAGSKEALVEQLIEMQGKPHRLHSGAVIFEDGRPVWRHVSTAQLMMRSLSDDFIRAYVDRNWDDVRYCVGGYMIEAEGPRLFSRITGDHFAILGLPLLEILSYLSVRGILDQ